MKICILNIFAHIYTSYKYFEYKNGDDASLRGKERIYYLDANFKLVNKSCGLLPFVVAYKILIIINKLFVPKKWTVNILLNDTYWANLFCWWISDRTKTIQRNRLSVGPRSSLKSLGEFSFGSCSASILRKRIGRARVHLVCAVRRRRP